MKCADEVQHCFIITNFELWLLQRQVKNAALTSSQHGTSATPTHLSSCMTMLRSAATKAASLNDQGHDMASFEQACEAEKKSIIATASTRAILLSEKFQLKPDPLSMSLSMHRLPEGILPPHLTASAQESESLMKEARRRAVINLGSYPMFISVNVKASSHSTFRQLHSAMQQPSWCKPADPVVAPLVLNVVERQLFSLASAGKQGLLTAVNKMRGCEIEEMTALESVVDAYRQLVHSFLSTPAGGTCMSVELLSREVLVVWVAYCLSDATARQLHSSSMEGYGVSASWQDLRHLVLSDRQATDAALGVAQYLHTYSQPGKELFSLANGGAPTFQMAAKFACGDAVLVGIWKSERLNRGRLLIGQRFRGRRQWLLN
jgi:hypothetical protein